MTATATMIATVRRNASEPNDDNGYTDAVITSIIETYPLVDERGEEPYTWDTSTTPPTKEDNDDWIATYDLNAAAADIWSEKASIVAQDFDFSAEGASYSRSNEYEQYMKQVRYYRARRSPSTIPLEIYPKITTESESFQ